MSTKRPICFCFVLAAEFMLLLNVAKCADLNVVNDGATKYEVAVALTSPGFKTARDGILRLNQTDMVRLSSDISHSYPWDLVVWKRRNDKEDWRFSTAFRIPRDQLVGPGVIILVVRPTDDRVVLAAAAPASPDDGTPPLKTIEPWKRPNQNGTNSNARPVRLGVNARKCPDGIHITNVTPGSAATRCKTQQTGQRVKLSPGDHVLTVNGFEPADIRQFQSLIGKSPRQIKMRVRLEKTKQTYDVTTNLW